MKKFFHAELESLRAFVYSYPMDRILRAFGQRCGHIDRILSDTLRALINQTQLCCKKLRSLQHHPCFRAMINLQPRIRRVHDATAHLPTAPPSPLLPTASATPFFLRSSDPSADFFARPSSRTFHFLLNFDLRGTFFHRPPSRVLFFGRLQYRHFGTTSTHGLTFGRLLSYPSHFL